MVFFAWLLVLVNGTSALAVNLTMVRHRFDIVKEFRQPSDVAVNGEGDIYVVDGVNHCVKVFGGDGRFLFRFGTRGAGRGEFSYPLGIDIDQQGRVYIADTGNRRIQIFTARGRFLSLVPVESTGEKPADPVDIGVTRDGTVGFVSDNDNHHILKYDLVSGRLLARFGKPGIERKEFRYPFLVSLYKDKYLHIVDVINTRVQVLTDTGKFVTFIGDWGVEKGQFFRPKGVAVDRDGLVYVSDSYMGVIQVFTSEGHFESVIGDPETGTVKRFKTPVGIYVDRDDRLYVVEMFGERVSVFDLVKN
ncbi:NHL repeat-containing protein [Desulfolithobacter dissulfuricans]|uniref:NHL repeat-containing protein n=1 Tax=Desulfolithobacter dissulfuricans TaxID=2795293 RepID=UPI002278833E|nr:NHL repeat-containing protein [Desulfolithobacter dissulfuricans]